VNQRELLQLWWLHLDELTRRRVLHLSPDQTLPDDVADQLRLHGITVTDLGTCVDSEGDIVQLWGQPVVLMDLILRERLSGGEPHA
jgi:hypothetical protein